jgi:hypothetical protein
VTHLIHWEPWQQAVQAVIIALVAGPIIAWKIHRFYKWLTRK